MYPSASEMILLSYEYFKEKKFEDIAYFEPYYLKEFISKSI
jgi:tRNA threonylcarbamoyladenosine biosynthesis protein TsaB